MKIVLDTNVLISGLLSPYNPPGRILDLIVSGDITLLVDDRILGEYREVCSRKKFGFAKKDIDPLLSFIESTAIHLIAKPLSFRLDDPDDDPFVEVAITGMADALVTGNVKHFTPAQKEAVIKSPADFLSGFYHF
ncbi:MAG: putative toxin-antitoxin system toxin component, PIN family [Deltaproteobacteria bacterium]|nr:putative toxin-antitoxin system toxin component, PIN family [Deltaproteobacteria bacterium]